MLIVRPSSNYAGRIRTLCGAMAIREMPPLALFEVRWRSGGQQGVLHTWAPTDRSAIRSVREHPSVHGIPHESVLIDRCRKVDVRAHGVKRAA